MSFEDDTFTTEGGRYTWNYSQFDDRDDTESDSFSWGEYLEGIDNCQTNRNVRYRAAKKISHLEYNYQARNKLVKLLFQDELAYSISAYANEEKLSCEYLQIVKNDNCLNVMLKGFLNKACKIDLSKSLVLEIDSLVDKVHINEDVDIVYNRVSEIQGFIHDTVDRAYGTGTQLNLPTTLVKSLLSATRLHLNIWDIKYQHSSDLFKIGSSGKFVGKYSQF
ncbi:MAG: hypothetical protein RQ899_13785 [Pseudomonadales bacterium]|nr:hypothetical protein [Pseudomonadales bacterium]